MIEHFSIPTCILTDWKNLGLGLTLGSYTYGLELVGRRILGLWSDIEVAEIRKGKLLMENTFEELIGSDNVRTSALIEGLMCW